EETVQSEPSSRKEKPRKPKGSRSFWVAAGVLTVLFILIVGVLSLLAIFVLPRMETARLQEAALINAHNTATVAAATNHAVMAGQIITPTPTNTEEPTSTPVIILFTEIPATATQESGIGAEAEAAAQTATAAALQAQATLEDPTATPTITPTPTALPETGLADKMGMPGLAGIALALVVIIFLVRKVRLTV
ncbi:MAG: LPXTG cell wall anchor domain-containing protein, partial [Anaerolineaceae bacterium]